jgi:hypothetical protein
VSTLSTEICSDYSVRYVRLNIHANYLLGNRTGEHFPFLHKYVLYYVLVDLRIGDDENSKTSF